MASHEPRLDFATTWRYAAAPESTEHVRIDEQYGLYIGGEFVAPRAGEYFETINPAREDVLARVGVADAGDVDRAVARRARGVRRRVVEAEACRARQVHLSHRAPPAGARARVRGHRVAGRRQADPRVARRRRAARGGTLLLLRRLGGQARVRVSRQAAARPRRRRPDHPLELSAAHGRVEDRAGARVRQHRRAEAGGDDAAHGAQARGAHPRRRPAARRREHRHRSPARPARRSWRIPASTRSPSPARRRSGASSSARSPAPAGTTRSSSAARPRT